MINNSLSPPGWVVSLFVHCASIQTNCGPSVIFRTVDGTTFTSSIKEKTVG